MYQNLLEIQYYETLLGGYVRCLTVYDSDAIEQKRSLTGNNLILEGEILMVKNLPEVTGTTIVRTLEYVPKPS